MFWSARPPPVTLRLFAMTSNEADNHFPAGLPGARPDFPTTHWTLVTRVREGGEVRRVALEELCALYWYPI